MEIKEKLQEKFKSLFTPQIIFRGRDYFTREKVEELYKDENKYIATVSGSDMGLDYDVEMILEEDDIKMSCTCPCIEHCKHEYAVLMAIDAGEYVNVKLLPVPDNGKTDIEKLINKIPEEELKKYLVKSFKNNESIDEDDFVDEFNNYLPEKSRDYFYNTLFNNFQLGKINSELLDFVSLAKKSVENKQYEYAYTIISAIIDAAKESNYSDDHEYLLNQYSKLAMFLRIAYRKSDDKLREDINNWIKKIEDKSYYNDIYLEDMLITITK